MPNFMLQDVAGCLRAVYLLPFFLVIPGYTIAWLCDLFDFRRRTGAFRLVFSVPFSIAICPVITYLLGRFASMTAVLVFYWVTAMGLAAIQLAAFLRARKAGRRPEFSFRSLGVFAAIVAAWLAICLGSLIDVQVGDRLYFPTSSIDNSVRTAFVNSISTTGIPPQNPFFSPAQPVSLRYHYFWLMMCSLAERVGNGGVSARQALIAGTFWCGLGLIALVALYLRLFSPGDPARFRKRTLTAALLLSITGLDILPTMLLVALYSRGALDFVLPSVEWWNEHVDWFLYTALWAPHALASLLAGLMGFLLLWKAPEERRPAGLLKYALLGGAALATAIGASIYVAFVFAVFLAVWTGITLWKRWYRETAALAAAGAACVALAFPYLLGLRGPAQETFRGDSPISFTVRTFSLAALVPRWHGMTDWMYMTLIEAPLLPLNYLLELGLFFLVGTIQWRRFRRRGGPLSRQELACTVMAATSILICTFLRSSVLAANDLGWRGFLPAQFILLLWAVDVLADRNLPDFLTAGQHRMLILFLILGALGTVYDLTLTRIYPILADRGVVPPQEWMAKDRQFGKRTYALREAYEWARSVTPDTAVVQYNPQVFVEDTTALLYADRRAIAGEMHCATVFGGDPRVCAPLVSELTQVYPLLGHASAPSSRDVCARLPIDLLVVKDTDSVWNDRGSWVWRQTPVFGNPYVRLFHCGEREPMAAR